MLLRRRELVTNHGSVWFFGPRRREEAGVAPRRGARKTVVAKKRLGVAAVELDVAEKMESI